MRASPLDELDRAERDAWKNLARYKFWQFGYYAARWVYLNWLAGTKRPNPFRPLVWLARKTIADRMP